MQYLCPVCGYPELSEPAYDAGTPSYEICPCCGYHFGYDDDDQHISHAAWRSQWISKGMKWFSQSTLKPVNWNPEGQLLNVT